MAVLETMAGILLLAIFFILIGYMLNKTISKVKTEYTYINHEKEKREAALSEHNDAIMDNIDINNANENDKKITVEGYRKI